MAERVLEGESGGGRRERGQIEMMAEDGPKALNVEMWRQNQNTKKTKLYQ